MLRITRVAWPFAPFLSSRPLLLLLLSALPLLSLSNSDFLSPSISLFLSHYQPQSRKVNPQLNMRNKTDILFSKILNVQMSSLKSQSCQHGARHISVVWFWRDSPPILPPAHLCFCISGQGTLPWRTNLIKTLTSLNKWNSPTDALSPPPEHTLLRPDLRGGVYLHITTYDPSVPLQDGPHMAPSPSVQVADNQYFCTNLSPWSIPTRPHKQWWR